jgi:hypothetical protein
VWTVSFNNKNGENMSLKIRLLAATLVGSMAATTANANNNNTGQIVIQGVVPGVWELSVYDINSGYDFDLAQGASTTTDARVGTIHVHCNDATTATGGANNANATIGHMTVESQNAGRLINNQSLNGIASDNQDYRLNLVENELSGTSAITATVNDPATAGPAGTTALTGTEGFDLTTPLFVEFATSADVEATYDVWILLGDGTSDVRPEAAGVYSDVLTFTIMDDG